jgi:hypothetical protein
MPSFARWAGAPALIAALAALAGCSLHQAAVNRMASALASSADVYEADDDPEFVRLAAPSTLKTIEMLLLQTPRNEDLLLTACRGFTEYSYAFLHVPGTLETDAAPARELHGRATQMYQRARRYCVRGFAVRHQGVTADHLTDHLTAMTARDVPMLYWTAASWAAELSIAPNQVMRIGEVASVRALLDRAKALDESWNSGAIYEVLIALDGLPRLAGGSPEAARADFDRARTLSNSQSAFAFVAYAATVADPAARKALLEKAIAIDVRSTPRRRLTNLIAQRYARAQLRAINAGR